MQIGQRDQGMGVEVEDRVHELRHQGPKGVSTPSHHIMSQLNSQ